VTGPDEILARASATIGMARYATAIDAGGHMLVSDEPVKAGGAGAGTSPPELLLAALGSCTAITLRMYADRKEWPLSGVRVALTLHRQDGATFIRRELRLDGELAAEQRARLAEIAERTPVTRMIREGTEIRTTVA
jgi:putative redox protein